MNTHSHPCWKFTAASVALALVGFISAPYALHAQVRGAQLLMKVQTVEDLQKIEPGDTIIMSCPKCKDTYAQVVEKTFRNAKPEEMKKVAIHLCSGCDTKIVTQGTGKQAKNVLVHTCKTCGSQDVSCCVMKKNGGTTAGMDMKK